MARPNWDTYFLHLAEVVATRASCPRKHVGAVIVDPDRRIVATGYNGSAAGMRHCDDVGCQMKTIDGRESCIRTLHAESNALDYAGGKAKGCTIYTTVTPCYECAKRLVNAGITRIVYEEYYESRNTGLVIAYLKQAGIKYQQLRRK
jgi:dCMP deaminase